MTGRRTLNDDMEKAAIDWLSRVDLKVARDILKLPDCARRYFTRCSSSGDESWRTSFVIRGYVRHQMECNINDFKGTLKKSPATGETSCPEN